MKVKQIGFLSCLASALVLAATVQLEAGAKKAADSQDEADAVPMASVFGMAGERYVFYGTGGITVDQTPKPGFWHSNMKVYKISIDGSGISGSGSAGGAASGNFPATNFATSNVDGDFKAFACTAYFVSNAAICTLPTATNVPGREIMVCNTSKGATITYNTTNGETVSGNPSGALTNSAPCKVDRFISDGKSWYRE